MSEANDRMREEFEAWFEPDEQNRQAIRRMRSGDEYTQAAPYLGGAWHGWQAAYAGKAALVEALRDILMENVLSPEGGHEAVAEIHCIAREALKRTGEQA